MRRRRRVGEHAARGRVVRLVVRPQHRLAQPVPATYKVEEADEMGGRPDTTKQDHDHLKILEMIHFESNVQESGSESKRKESFNYDPFAYL